MTLEAYRTTKARARVPQSLVGTRMCQSQKLKCCFTSTETVGLLRTGAQDVYLDFYTAPEL